MSKVWKSYNIFKKNQVSPAQEPYTCNPNHLGDGDQEDQGSRPAGTNSFWDPILKILNTIKTGW
jgi:hypothetical protein